MVQNYPEWLSKQMLLGLRRFDIDSYLVALEGWRRGLALKFYYDPSTVTDLELTDFDQIGKVFSLESNEKKHFFYRTRGDKVSHHATKMGTDQKKVKQHLREAGTPTPESLSFYKEEKLEDIIRKAVQLGFPLVLKPTDKNVRRGVITDIFTEEALKKHITDVFTEFGNEDFIIERQIEGEALRLYVIEDRVIAAAERIPANVTGDGFHTISELIDQKNTLRKENPYTSTRRIKKDSALKNHLKQQGLNLEFILENNKIVSLREEARIATGGDTVDMTDYLSEETKHTAIQAVKTIPGLHHAGLDVVVNEAGTTVIGINPTAGITLHSFPVHGMPKNVAEKIIDYYFPETQEIAEKSHHIYFDYKTILQLLRSHSLKELEVTDAPVGPLYAKRYVISGKVQKVGYRKWIRKQALAKGLHGYTRNLNNGKVVVVVASSDKEEVDSFKQTCWEGPARSEVTDVQDYLWEKQIEIGFEIRLTRKSAKK